MFKASFFVFCNIGPNLAQILLQSPCPLSFFFIYLFFFFFADFQRYMKLEDSININNLCHNPVVLKKMVKPLKNCFLGLNLHKNRSLLDTPKLKKNFFGRNNKSISSVFRNFLFYQNMFWLSYESFSIFSDYSSQQLKQLWIALGKAYSSIRRVTWLCIIFWCHHEMRENNHAHLTAMSVHSHKLSVTTKYFWGKKTFARQKLTLWIKLCIKIRFWQNM